MGVPKMNKWKMNKTSKNKWNKWKMNKTSNFLKKILWQKNKQNNIEFLWQKNKQNDIEFCDKKQKQNNIEFVWQNINCNFVQL